MKTCSNCGTPKAVEDFYRDAARADGRKSQCKACELAAPRKYRITCATCGKRLYAGRKGSLPQGEANCQPCRRKRALNSARRCAGCGEPVSSMNTVHCAKCVGWGSSGRKYGGWREQTKRLGNAEQRGYGAEHRREREKWVPIVAAGRAVCQQGLPGNGSSGTCVEPSRVILPGARWALGHTDDRTGWIGPVHHRCNLIDAATRGGIARAAKHGPYRGQGRSQAAPRIPSGW